MKESRKSHLFTNKVILAPMVRANSLAFRLLCLNMGADLVYTEELIDYRLSACRRLENNALGTVDFVDDRGEVIFRTCPLEKNRLVLQLGSNHPGRALKAAKLVCRDVMAIDFNFGCPKSFSLSGGMGAALLEKPDEIEALLTTCVNNLTIPVTCKIRLLPQLDKTLKLVKLIESCGVSAIAVHGRTKEQRSHEENDNDAIRIISKNIRVPVIANGHSNHIKLYSDIVKFKELTKASSVMIARAALRNPSIFNSEVVESKPIDSVISEFIKLSVKYDNSIANTKYLLPLIMASGKYGGQFVHKFHTAGDLWTICKLFGLESWYSRNQLTISKTDFYAENILFPELAKWIDEMKQKLSLTGKELVQDNIPYSPKIFGPSTPKAVLMDHVNKLQCHKPEFDIFQIGKRSYYCVVNFQDRCYLNTTFSNNKKSSEHATALLICDNMNLIKLDDYKRRTRGLSRNIG